MEGIIIIIFSSPHSDASTDYHDGRLENGQQERPQILINETAFNVDEELGAAGDREKLKEMMSQGRREIRQALLPFHAIICCGFKISRIFVAWGLV